MINHKIITGLSFILAGIFSLLSFLGVLSVSIEEVIGFVFIFYSIPTVYISFEKEDRTKLVLAVILFLIGVLIFVKSHYELLDSRGLIFTSILFINGSIFLILFLENTREKIFIYISASSFLLSYLSFSLLNKFGLFRIADKIANLLEVFWPVILIVMGMTIFINRKK